MNEGVIDDHHLQDGPSSNDAGGFRSEADRLSLHEGFQKRACALFKLSHPAVVAGTRGAAAHAFDLPVTRCSWELEFDRFGVAPEVDHRNSEGLPLGYGE